MANWRQFSLQMALIVCVGLVLGTERTVLPIMGRELFHLQSYLVIGSFVVSFGLVKAVLNLIGGRLSERFGRKPLLVAGWASALPIPILLLTAPSWSWVVLANVLLGINQGLAWSMSVNAKIDLVGSARRGLAVGLDEAGGYGGMALGALITAYLAAAFGLRPAPFLFAALVIALALLMGAVLMEETLPYAGAEAETAGGPGAVEPVRFGQIFALASFRSRTLFAIAQAGAVEKFVDTLVWLAFPLYLRSQDLSLDSIGKVAFVYGIVWGLGQIPAGQLADRIGRKAPIAIGMFICAAGVFAVPLASGLTAWLAASAVAGAGMALLYPNLMTAAADAAHPSWRATGLGVYRFWRDTGYAAGAIVIGLVANQLGLAASFYGVAVAMTLSALIVVAAMKETSPVRASAPSQARA